MGFEIIIALFLLETPCDTTPCTAIELKPPYNRKVCLPPRVFIPTPVPPKPQNGFERQRVMNRNPQV